MSCIVHEIAIQYNTIKFYSEKCQSHRSHFTVSCGKEAEDRRVLILVLTVRRHCEDVTSDGRLFQVLAAATGNARSPIVESRVSGTASAEVDDERRRCRPGSPAT